MNCPELGTENGLFMGACGPRLRSGRGFIPAPRKPGVNSGQSASRHSLFLLRVKRVQATSAACQIVPLRRTAARPVAAEKISLPINASESPALPLAGWAVPI